MTGLFLNLARLTIAFGGCIVPARALPAKSAAAWDGRVITSTHSKYGAGVTFTWEGVTARFRVGPGTSNITMVANKTFPSIPQFHVLLDGEDGPPAGTFHLYSSSDGKIVTYNILLNIDPTVSHNVTLYYMSDPLSFSWPNLTNGTVTILDLSTDAGPLIPNPPSGNRSLLFIGDSITAADDIDPLTCADDHWGSYGAKLCRYFGTSCTTAAIGGTGIYMNGRANCPTMAVLWDRVLVNDDTTASPPPKPDAIHINLGTNDKMHYNGTAAWAAAFSATYAQFILHLTGLYGAHLPIFLGIGPVSYEYYPWVIVAMQEAGTGGATNMHIINYTVPVNKCGHPSYEAHSTMAIQAAPIISAVLGW